MKVKNDTLHKSKPNQTTNQQFGYALIFFGIMFVVMQITGFNGMALLWPLFVLVPGAALLYIGLKDEHADIEPTMAGTIVGGTGLILMVLNITGHWAAWAYIWALYPLFVGVALRLVGTRNGKGSMIKQGRQLIQVGTYMLIGFGFFFEVLIFDGGAIFNSILIPVALIGGGLYVLYGTRR
jgi:hypothetical protein